MVYMSGVRGGGVTGRGGFNPVSEIPESVYGGAYAPGLGAVVEGSGFVFGEGHADGCGVGGEGFPRFLG